MLTGEIRSQIDHIWNAFWSGGISNPLEVIEQITYLLFIRRLDDLHTLEENKANRLKKPMERRVFPEGKDAKRPALRGLPLVALQALRAGRDVRRWSASTSFPFLARQLGGDDSTYAHHMKDARFTIPTPALLAKVVDMLDQVPMEERDTKGDLYEYMLGKIATAGQNGQFRTPRHIIRLMVEMTAPQPTDVICDPACGTAGFLVAAGEYLRERHPNLLHDAKLREHFHHGMFHGFDFDNTMLRIGSMNMLLHGVENPDIRYRDSLAQDHAGEEEKYTLVLANPPFAGSLDYENTRQGPAADRQDEEDRAALPRALPAPAQARRARRGDRARRRAVRLQQGAQGRCAACWWRTRSSTPWSRCPAACSSPTPASPPRSCSSPRPTPAARTTSGSTTSTADGWSLDDKRTPLLPEDKLGPCPALRSAPTSTRRTTCPTCSRAGPSATGSERERPRTAQSFCVPKADIAAQGYDLSLNRYKEVVHEEVEHRPPKEILAELAKLEEEIQQGMKELEGMLGVRSYCRSDSRKVAEVVRGASDADEVDADDSRTACRIGESKTLMACDGMSSRSRHVSQR